MTDVVAHHARTRQTDSHRGAFLRRLRRYARKRRMQIDYRPDRGKGSHAQVRLDARTTSVRRGELGPGLLRKMLRDLDVDKQDF